MRIIELIFLLFFATSCQHGYSSTHPSLSDKPEPLVESFLELMNAPTAERISEFAGRFGSRKFRDFNDFTIKDHLTGFFSPIYHISGGFTLERFDSEGARCTLVLKDRVYGLRHFLPMDFLVENGVQKLDRYRILDTPITQDLPSLPNADAFIAATKRKIHFAGTGEHFSGTVLIAHRGRILVHESTGLAERVFRSPININTRFNIASQGKMFTGVALMQLVEQGKVSLDDPLGKYLDNTWLADDLLSIITLRHLMTHRSGLGTFFTVEYEKASPGSYDRLEDYKRITVKSKPAFSPGEGYRYSNIGMLLLGAIVAFVEGKDFYDCMKEMIFSRSEMDQTGYYPVDVPAPNIATGYDWEDTSPFRYRNNLSQLKRGTPAGGTFSTLHDMFRFGSALLNHRLLSESTLRSLTHAEEDTFFSLGERKALGPYWGHNGGLMGASTEMYVFPDTGYTVIVMSNFTAGAQLMAQWILGTLSGSIEGW